MPNADDHTGSALASSVTLNDNTIVDSNVKINTGTYTEHNHYAALPPQLTAAELAAAQALLATLPLDAVPDVAALPTPHRMLLSTNPLFVGRAADLRALAQTLKAGTTTVVAAATGMGGLGKTQLASEFVHRYGSFFAGGVFWLSFADPASVEAEIVICGGPGVLDLPGFAALTFTDQVRRVRQEWQQPIPRLLVFDNCEDEALLARYRPTSGGCRVLLTSRRRGWDVPLGVSEWRLQTLPRTESVALVRQFRPDLAADDHDLATLAAELGDLPLALHVAGSYLHRYRQRVTPGQYLVQLHSVPLQAFALRVAGATPTGHERDVARTFSVSYQQLDAHDPIDTLALALLARAAHFSAGEPIPRNLLIETVTAEAEDAPAPDALDVDDALSRLDALGLIDTEGDSALRLHRLLAAFVRATRADPAAQTAVEQTMLPTANRLNNAGFPAPLLALQSHLRHIADAALVRADPLAADLGDALGYHLAMVGDYAGARPYLERALAINEAALGASHPTTARSLNNLGYLLQTQGDYVGARPYYERALAIKEAALGASHPTTATSLNNLGELLRAQGDYVNARPYYERALAIKEAARGEFHPTTAISVGNLGALLQAQGDYAGARPYFERALAINEAALGTSHPTTATSLNNLGALLNSQGDAAGAYPYYARALAIREAALGASHPTTATSLNNLGYLLDAQGDAAGARPYYERALAIYEAALGASHPDTATSLNNLGYLLQAQGDDAGARPYYERALVIRATALGASHPTTAQSLNNLGYLLQAQGDYAGARPYYERALAINEAALGAFHPDTATSLNNLGYLLDSQGDYAGARPYYERALVIRATALGASHPTTAQSLNNLGYLLQAQGDYAGARPYYERALAINEAALGAFHPDTATSLNNLAVLCDDEENFTEAAALMRRALAIREATLGAHHPDTQRSQRSLAAIEQRLRGTSSVWQRLRARLRR